MGPVVGITTAHYDEEISTYPRQYYVEAVHKSGGLPLLLPVLTDTNAIGPYLKMIDGLVLTGGCDVGPKHFGQEPLRGMGKVYPERDVFELELTRKSLDINLPVLGICRGIQVMNIAMGGDIYQDLYSQEPGALEHSQKTRRDCAWHSVGVQEDSLLNRILRAKELRVNSFHHQAIKSSAPGFRVSAAAKDGIIEAIESDRHRFALGVQWHPEAMATTDPLAAKLFRAFVEFCGEKQ